jgi:hypothetical protein
VAAAGFRYALSEPVHAVVEQASAAFGEDGTVRAHVDVAGPNLPDVRRENMQPVRIDTAKVGGDQGLGDEVRPELLDACGV